MNVDKVRVTYIKSIVGPASKLHVAVLIVKWKPGDVDLTCRFEYTRRDIGTSTIACYNNIGWIGSIKSFTRTKQNKW